MRAIYLNRVEIKEKISELPIEPFQFDHLKKVARIKEGEDLLVLNGLGIKYYGKLNEFKKKSIIFELSKKEEVERGHNLSLALLMPKKDAFEETVQKAVQLGIKNIFTFHSQFSQFEITEINERLKTMLISGYQQSNNAFEVNIHPTKKLEDLKNIVSNFNLSLYFTSQSDTDFDSLSIDAETQILYLVGPEGGLTQDEEIFLKSLSFSFLNLPVPLLRTPTAVTIGAGYILSKFS